MLVRYLICYCCLISFFASNSIHALAIDIVSIGNPGNAPDTITGLGGVSERYAIGSKEVSNKEYVTFLNAVDPIGANLLRLYSVEMTTNATVGGIDFDINASSGFKYTTLSESGGLSHLSLVMCSIVVPMQTMRIVEFHALDVKNLDV